MTDTQKATRPRRFARMPKADASAVSSEPASLEAGTPVQPAAEEAAQPTSKIAQVVALFKREEGATLAEMVAATGWQPHTTRAALTGLKKKAHAIERTKRGDVTCYRISAGA